MVESLDCGYLLSLKYLWQRAYCLIKLSMMSLETEIITSLHTKERLLLSNNKLTVNDIKVKEGTKGWMFADVNIEGLWKLNLALLPPRNEGRRLVAVKMTSPGVRIEFSVGVLLPKDRWDMKLRFFMPVDGVLKQTRKRWDKDAGQRVDMEVPKQAVILDSRMYAQVAQSVQLFVSKVLDIPVKNKRTFKREVEAKPHVFLVTDTIKMEGIKGLCGVRTWKGLEGKTFDSPNKPGTTGTILEVVRTGSKVTGLKVQFSQ